MTFHVNPLTVDTVRRTWTQRVEEVVEAKSIDEVPEIKEVTYSFQFEAVFECRVTNNLHKPCTVVKKLGQIGRAHV